MGVLCLILHQIALEMEPAVRNNRVIATILKPPPWVQK
jgi:hypothetical protein